MNRENAIAQAGIYEKIAIAPREPEHYASDRCDL